MTAGSAERVDRFEEQFEEQNVKVRRTVYEKRTIQYSGGGKLGRTSCAR